MFGECFWKSFMITFGDGSLGHEMRYYDDWLIHNWGFPSITENDQVCIDIVYSFMRNNECFIENQELLKFVV